MEEDNQIFSNILQEESELTVNEVMQDYLQETRKWASFFAVLGFIGSGLMILLGFSMFVAGGTNSIFSNVFGGISLTLLAFVYFIAAALYIPPSIYLYKFSATMKIAIAKKNNKELENAFMNLKSTFRYGGILTIVILFLYLIGIVIAILGGMAAAMMMV